MIDNMGMYQGYSVEGNAELKITPEMTVTPNMMTTNNQYSMCGNAPLPGVVCPPVYECPQERCFHRQIVHEVPHVCYQSEYDIQKNINILILIFM